MINNLRLTTERNQEQDWLKTNLNKFTRMMQGERDLATVGQKLLSELAPLVNAHQGVFYQMDASGGAPGLMALATYAHPAGPEYEGRVRVGEGLVGQCAHEKQRILIKDVPSTGTQVRSGLFETAPRSVVVLPSLFEGDVKAVIELASVNQF